MDALQHACRPPWLKLPESGQGRDTMAVPEPGRWIPGGQGVHMVEAGDRHGWDAVRMPAAYACAVLDALGQDTGAVIDDQLNGVYYWLVPTRALVLPPVRDCPFDVLGNGTSIAVPGLARQRPVTWRVQPLPDRILTCPRTLSAAIITAGLATTGEAAGQRRRVSCTPPQHGHWSAPGPAGPLRRRSPGPPWP
ncbi:hypothetical protein ACFP1Z_32785 [Streptomyces gamaensis]|uniref:Uncharacterized protein n=1 Tax=Streptomyces gamaensis TaxID=1763542 RepID=A0ABW0Z955_9ACTN